MFRIRIHTGEWPFKCSLCTRSLTRDDRLRERIAAIRKSYTKVVLGTEAGRKEGK